MSKKLFLVDGSNHAFRVQFALPPMTAKDGFPTRALYGFTTLFAKVLREHQPDYVAVCFDKGSTFRHEMYPEYKGHRPDMPEDLRQQWPHFEELIEGFGAKYLTLPGYEADDVIGTLATRYADECDVFLLTGDKDFCQIVSDKIHILDLMKDREIGPDDVVDKMGVPADKVIDLLGLVGDSSDNIPGIPGVGPKKAQQFLAKYGDLEGVLANADDIGGKTGEKVKAHADNARLSYKLATIDINAPVPVTLDDLKMTGIDAEKLRPLFDQWEFGALARKLLGSSAKKVDVTGYRVIGSAGELDTYIASVRKTGRVAVGVHYAGDDARTSDLLGVSLCHQDATAVYVPWTKPGGALTVGAFRGPLSDLLSDPTIRKVCHDSKAITQSLATAGIAFAGVEHDLLLADYVVAAHERSHDMVQLAERLLTYTPSDYARQSSTDDALFADPVVFEQTRRFCAEPAHMSWLLGQKLVPHLKGGMKTLYNGIELPLVPVLTQMEAHGIRLDVDALAVIREDIVGQVELARASAFEAAGREFDIDGRKDLQKLLFEELELPTGKKLKGGFSTDASVLEKLSELHPLPAKIMEYRKLNKLVNTYLDALPTYLGEDGRIHTSFNQAVAATGRLSSGNPNLQNIPVRTAEGRRIRGAFIPDPGHKFLSADYSQIELRILAHFTGEGPLVDSFLAGDDIHARTASEVFGVERDAVTIELRSAAKAINFGLLYGMSAFRLGGDLGIPQKQAAQYIEDYFDRMPTVRAWLESTKELAKENGYVETLYGRRRLLPDIHSGRFNERAAAEREATNTPIQGTAADLIKLAMIKVDSVLRESGSKARLLLQVHDELLLSVPEDEIESVTKAVSEAMSGVAELAVPLAVNTAVGDNWQQAHG